MKSFSGKALKAFLIMMAVVMFLCGSGAVYAAPAVTPMIVGSSGHTLALKSDGTVWAWGYNNLGQLGDGSAIQSITPVQVKGVGGTGFLTGIISIAAGGNSSYALKSDGTVWAWGNNSNGQLGDGTVTSSSTPVQVKGPGGTGVLNGIIAIAGNNRHILALKSDGTVWGWGYNFNGQLGDNTITDRSTPVQVKGAGGAGFLSGVIRIAAGSLHSLALKSDGTVWTWGANASGQLGDGTIIQSKTPVQVKGVGGTGFLTGVTSVFGGTDHSLALKSDGTVWAWGNNSNGQLGDGTVTSSSTPVQVKGVGGTGVLSGISSISAGNKSSRTSDSSGNVWVWGYNGFGQLGNNTITDSSTPIQVKGVGGVGFLTGIIATSGDTNCSFALKNDGTLWAWGNNTNGQLGNNSTTQSKTPVQVKGVGGTGVFNLYVAPTLTSISPSGGTPGDTITLTGTNFVSPAWNNIVKFSISGGTANGYVTGVTSTTLTVMVPPNTITGNVTVTVGASVSSPVTFSFQRNFAFEALIRGSHSLGLKSDGTVWGWGDNSSGQLGDGTLTNSSTPVQVVSAGGSGVLTGITSLAIGALHSLALKNDGTVWAWGDNGNSQLGDGTTTTRFTPVQVSGLSSVVKIVSGDYFSLALKSDGTVWAWGLNSSGQLGDGTTISRSTPVQVKGVGGAGFLTGVLTLSAGYRHALALKSDGTVWAWGDNQYGQLGDGSATGSSAPVQVKGMGGIGFLTGITSLSGGFGHSLALRNDGTVWAWGLNSSGQLGDGSTTNRSTPVQVTGSGGSGVLTGITTISGGSDHSLALKNDNTVWSWGSSQYGQLGNGSATSSSVPVQVKGVGGAGVLTGVSSVSAGNKASLALKSDGSTAWSWGYNISGQLGDGTVINRSVPVQVVGAGGAGSFNSYSIPVLASINPLMGAPGDTITLTGTGFSSSASGNTVTFAISGGTTSGYVTNATSTTLTVMVPPNTITGNVTVTVNSNISNSVNFTFQRKPKVVSGSNYTVSLKDDGTVWAWGDNLYGQLGDGTIINRSSPVQVSGLSGVVSVSSSTNHTVALKSDGTVWAWGYNISGQLGDGSTTSSSTPVQVKGSGGTGGLSGIIAVSAKGSHTAALKSDGTVWTWGNNASGQLGNGNTTSSSTPVQVSGLSGVVGIATGDNHTLALKSDGTVWAWGLNSSGQLGDGTIAQRITPVQISGVSGVSAIAGGSSHSLALKSDGTVWAWGLNNSGQLGDGGTGTQTSPVQVVGSGGTGVLTDIVFIESQALHSVALKSDGTVWVWGNNANGQLGDGTTTNSSFPVQVSGFSGAFLVGAGSGHTVALKPDGTVWGWGGNGNGQLGDGTTTGSSAPVQAVGAGGTGTLSLYTVIPSLSSVEPHFGTIGDTITLTGTNFVSPASNNIVKFTISGGTANGYVTGATSTSLTVVVPPGTITGNVTVSVGAKTSAPVTFTFQRRPMVAAGKKHSLSLKTDGTVWSWGNNGNGQLGDGTVLARTAPVQVSGLSGVVSVVSGDLHSVALKGDGTVWAWGSNSSGQLGDGTVLARIAPVQVSGLNGVIALAGGSNHTVALKSDGTVWAWGLNGSGQLGDGTTLQRKTPVQVSGLHHVVAIAAGGDSTFALKNDGTVWSWGFNAFGQLGDCTTTDRSSPVQVNGLSGALSVTAGNSHALALKSDGTVWGWGFNSNGQLGDGTTTNRTSPVQVNGLSGAFFVTAGDSHTLVLKNDGTVWGWGLNTNGQLGDGTTTQRTSPVQVSSGISSIFSVSGGGSHAVALKSDGTVWVWGNNTNGQLGDGTTVQRISPVQAKGAGGAGTLNLYTVVPTLTALSPAYGTVGDIITLTGSNFVLFPSGNSVKFTTSGGTANGYVISATGTTLKVMVPANTITGDVTVSIGANSSSPLPFTFHIRPQSAAAGSHTLALKNDGTVWAWGKNNNGQLGDGTLIDRSTPVQVGGLNSIVSVAGGSGYSVALKSDGTVWTWGDNTGSRLGVTTATTQQKTPVQISGLSGILAISTGGSHTLALKSDGTVWGWGQNSYGQAGKDVTTTVSPPVQLIGLRGIIALAAGDSHSLALKNDGTVWGWGLNSNGQLGDGTTKQSFTPVQVKGAGGAGVLADIIAVTGAGSHSVALKSDGTVWAWGLNSSGQLGDGTTTDSATPVQVKGSGGAGFLTGVTSIDSDGNFSLALKNGGTAWIWGDNSSGQLGNGTTANSSIPVQVSGLTGVSSVSGGSLHTVVLKNDGSVWAWGSNANSQLGDNTTTQRLTSVQVVATGGTGTFNLYLVPVLTSITPSGGVPGSIVTLTGSNFVLPASNNTVTFTAPGGTVNATVTSATPTSLTVTVPTGVATGNVTVTVNGNTSNGKLFTLSVPVITSLNPASGIPGDSITISGTNFETTASNNVVTFTSAGGTVNATITSATSTTLTVTVPAGAVTGNVTVTSFGSTSNGKLFTLRVPVITSLSPVSGVPGDSITISGANFDTTASNNVVTFTSAGGTVNATVTSATSTTLTVTVPAGAVTGNVTVTAFGSTSNAKLFTTLTPVITAITPGSGIIGDIATITGVNFSPTAADNTVLFTSAGGTVNATVISSTSTSLSVVVPGGITGNVSVQVGGNSSNTILFTYAVIFNKKAAAGLNHSLILKKDGTVWAWGDNQYGQLGDGTTVSKQTPVQVSGLTGIISIRAGANHSLALRNDGTVWVWGDNQYGQLGDGSFINRSVPVQVSGLSGVSSLSAGANHSVALRNDGTVWTWGLNSNGQLGDGTTVNKSLPLSVKGVGGVSVIAAGESHTLALQNGSIWAWGLNSSGQLGDGTTLNRLSPVQVPSPVGVLTIAAGANHSLALKNDDTVWAWGSNAEGALGDGTTANKSLPVQVPGVRGVISLCGGTTHTLVLKSDGTVWGWGGNAGEQLGDNGADRRTSPVQLPGIDGVSGLATGFDHAIALKPDGSVWGWGAHNSGQLGNGVPGVTNLNKSTPVQVAGLAGITHITAGYDDSFARKNDGTVWAWGNNSFGELGDGTTNNKNIPIPVASVNGTTLLSAGTFHTLALKNDGTVWGWGNNSSGQLGDGSRINRANPVQTSGLSIVSAVTAGLSHSLALKADGTVWGWGANQHGQLGDGTVTERTVPVLLSALSGVSALSAGGDHSLALKSDGTVWAWGSNASGQLGDGTTTDKASPVQVSGLVSITAVSAGSDHSLALKNDGTVWVWGNNGSGQLGNGTTTGSTTPVKLTSLSGITAVSAGSGYSLALKSDGTVWAWGNNQYGQLGDGTMVNKTSPVKLTAINGVSALSAGYKHSLALKNDGTVWAWGWNNAGQLGLSQVVQVVGSGGVGLLSRIPPRISSLTPSRVPVGGSVTITGTNFSPTVTKNIVSFAGGVIGHITSATATSLTVTIPPDVLGMGITGSSSGRQAVLPAGGKTEKVTVIVDGMVSNAQSLTILPGATIPTLSEWGLLLLGFFLFGRLLLNKRKNLLS